MTKPIKQCDPLIFTLIQTKLGNYVSERLSIDIYYLIEAIYTLINDLDEDFCKKNIPGYDDLIENLEEVDEMVGRAKIYYDSLSDTNKMLNPSLNKLQKSDQVQMEIRKQFSKNSARIPLIRKDIYKLAVSLIKLSSIKNHTIFKEYMRLLEDRNKPFDSIKKEVSPLK